MSEEVMGRKLVLFRTNGHFVFTSVCNGITTQIKHDMASFFASIHYVTHITNLAMKNLSTQSLVDKLINSLQGIYIFLKIGKNVFELERLASFAGCEGFEDFSKCENMVVVSVFSCKKGVGNIQTP